VVLGKAVNLPQAKWAPQRIGMAVDSPVRGMVSYTPSAEQNVVRLTPNTALTIDRLTTTDTGADTVGDTELNLTKGAIYASVKKLSPAAQYIVKTPTGIAGVRGTQFSIALNPDGSIKSIEVFKTTGDDGLVLAVTLANGTTQTFTIGQGMTVDFSSGTVVPIAPEILNQLNLLFTAFRTTYFQVTGFDYDRTFIPTSSDVGNYSTPPPAPI
jgi:ferric-dicitrate binding protein FerR (iron transport regulator)